LRRCAAWCTATTWRAATNFQHPEGAAGKLLTFAEGGVALLCRALDATMGRGLYVDAPRTWG
jgi:hypothetical protein